MKIQCNRSNLLKSVNIALRAIPLRSTMPILECILISADEKGIFLTSNDTELGLETRLEGSVLEPGRIAIHARMFSEIVRRLPDNIVTLEADNNLQIRITCEKAKFNLAGQSDEDFVYLPEPEREDCVTVSQYTLRKMIQQTIFSVAANDNNRIMGSELFEIRGDILRLVSLDGHRISMRKVQLRETCENKKVLVDGKTLNEICKIFTGEIDDLVNIFFAGNYIIFEMTDTTVISRLVDGEYFAVDQMISSDFDTRLQINKQAFLSCMDRASLFVREGDKKPILLNIAGDTMTLSIESQLGSLKEDIEIVKEGRDLLIGFNPRFLIDALKAIEEEEITLYLTNAKAPCIIRDKEEMYTYLILPVNFTR